MKTKKLFVFALAAMTFAACNNDDAPATGGNSEGTGEIIDAITVAFTNPKNTYAYNGTVDGRGTENNVYTAYIFAKENNPEHAGALLGDWTVKEVENGGAAIAEGSIDQAGTRKNMATFKGVRQGDNVYVIANDPNMTLTIASGLAHKGGNSEASIKAYISGMSKEYLNGLTKKVDGTQDGKFIMAGKTTIPTNPTIENGGTVIVPVALDRELAKVTFSASVTGDPDMEAYKRVKIESGDGLVIARIARKVSFFTTQDRDWYFPFDGGPTAKDWEYNGNNEVWKNAFNGATHNTPTTTDAPFFNNIGKDAAKEYRLTWDTSNSSDLITYVTPNGTDIDGGAIASPFFYVTPNYANSSACATVIVTQATYTGHTTLIEKVTDDVLTAAGYTPSTIAADFWDTTTNIDALLTAIQGTSYAADFTGLTTTDLIDYEPGMKLFYRADIANYNDDNATSQNVTERNTFYQIQGTITSLGAKSIEEAIDNTDIDMIVQVTVKPWNVVINFVNM